MLAAYSRSPRTYLSSMFGDGFQVLLNHFFFWRINVQLPGTSFLCFCQDFLFHLHRMPRTFACFPACQDGSPWVWRRGNNWKPASCPGPLFSLWLCLVCSDLSDLAKSSLVKLEVGFLIFALLHFCRILNSTVLWLLLRRQLWAFTLPCSSFFLSVMSSRVILLTSFLISYVRRLSIHSRN